MIEKKVDLIPSTKTVFNLLVLQRNVSFCHVKLCSGIKVHLFRVTRSETLMHKKFFTVEM